MANRAAIGKAVATHPRVATGGTSAPKAAGNGIFPQQQLTGPWNPKGQTKNTAYNQGFGKHNPAAPPASASPYAPTPWDSQYELSKAGSASKFNNTNISLDLKQKALEQDYGLDAGFNDYQTNPYSRAALLEQTYQRANRGTVNSYAAAGQLYAGSTQNELGYNRDSNSLGSNSLWKEHNAALQGIRDERAAASANQNAENNEAGWKRVERAGEAPLDPSTSPEPAKKAKSKANPKANNKRLNTIHEAVSNARGVKKGKR